MPLDAQTERDLEDVRNRRSYLAGTASNLAVAAKTRAVELSQANHDADHARGIAIKLTKAADRAAEARDAAAVALDQARADHEAAAAKLAEFDEVCARFKASIPDAV